jgi:hypothetical protein
VQPATRSMQPWAIVATLAGALVLAAVTGLSLNAVPPLPGKIVLGISLPIFYGTALAAITPASPPRRSARLPRQHSDHPAPMTEDDQRHPSEAERVRAWRRARLAALGVPKDAARILADDSSFSVHDLKQLLAEGCPLRTALRILWPA